MCVAAPWHGSSEYVQCLLRLVCELSQSTLLKYVPAMNSFFELKESARGFLKSSKKE